MSKLLQSAFAAFIILTAGSASALDCSEPKAYVESVKSEVISTLQGAGDDEQKRTALYKIFNQVADTEWMSKFVLGNSYKTLTPEQQKEYSKAYSDFLSGFYVEKFRQYDGQTVTINNVKPINADFMVDTTIQSQGKSPVNVKYRLRKSGSCYKIADILAEGVSLLNTQRQDFNSVVSSKGYEGLISMLRSRATNGEASTAVPVAQ